MALPASGSISMAQVATELEVALNLSLGAANVRALAGVASGAIGMSNLRGKSNFTATMPTTIHGGGMVFDFRPATAAAGATVTATPSDGVTYAWSKTGIATLTINGASATVRYSSRFTGTETGTLTCVVTRGAATITLNATYYLTIESSELGPDL